jgi:CheY-like chemotaxis protein
MALRVLLADESLSIKKVMQLALQDFAVEVKAVPVGVDVISVAKSWNPDIFFVDVLLAKKNGYEVSSDIKNDSSLSKIPVVLMWSGFMDIDEAKARQSKADRRLEKPFDADTLRNIVKDLVPMTKGNAISEFLTYPHLPDFVDKAQPPVKTEPSAPPVAARPAASKTMPPPPPKVASKPAAPAQPMAPPPTPAYVPEMISEENIETVEFNSSDLNNVDLSSTEMESDEPEAFTQVPLPSYGSKKGFGDPLFTNTPSALNHTQQESWSSGDLERFKINLPKEDLMELDSNMTDIMESPIVLAGQGEVQLGDIGSTEASLNTRASSSAHLATPHIGGIAPHLIDPAVIEQVLREQIKLVLHDIAWKIIPDITERIVREEINKLLKDAEKLT